MAFEFKIATDLSRAWLNSESPNYFRQALTVWDKAWQVRLQSEAGLLENKAIALLCLEQPDEALATLREAIAKRQPGDVLELEQYELLAESPTPPDGLPAMMALVREATEDSG